MPSFEIKMDGQVFLSVENGKIHVYGQDFHSDLAKLSRLSDILQDILETAGSLQRPRLVSDNTGSFSKNSKAQPPRPLKRAEIRVVS